MKFIQKLNSPRTSNLMAIKKQTKRFYRAIRELHGREEMLLYARHRLLHDPVISAFQKTTEDGETHPCKDCGKVFKGDLALQRHQTFFCSNSTFECRPDSQSSERLTSHNYDENITSPVGSPGQGLCKNTEGGDFQCEECPRSFAVKSNLARHQIVHEPRRRFSCAHCDRCFTDLSNLQRHLRSQHHGARCHACIECGKTFATLSGLKQHQHIHSSVKPFQCEVCLKAYTQFSNLCRHKRMHADCRQQIKCNDCGQTFSTITSLSKHTRFCDRTLRNDLRLGRSFGTDAKLCHSSPLLNAVPFSPALMMGLINSGAPFPFYSQLHGTLPMFPARHPLAAWTTLPSGSITSHEMAPLTPSTLDLNPAVHYDNRVPDGSDGGSEVMSESDLDNIPSETDSEQTIRQSQQILNTSTQSDVFTMSKPTAFVPSALPSQLCNLSPSINTQTVLSRQCTEAPSAFTKVETNEQSFEHSKPSEQYPRTPPSEGSLSTFKKDGKLIDGEQPLDLSQRRDITAIESSRKTHVFGEPRTPTAAAEPRLHYAYPQFSKQFLMEHALRLSESKDKSPETASYLPFTQFPFSGPKQYPAGMNPFGFVNPESPKCSTSVTPMSMSSLSATSSQINGYPDFSGSPQLSGQFATCTKIKDRYTCKFCGKVFPRSANLTRHLRTHTGEQPYKCKYCDRSFSISSNLQRHVRNIHDKEKPFRCALCDRCFGQQTNLDRHLKKHESEGSSMADSPDHTEERVAELNDKDKLFFSEIHSVIGKAASSSKTSDNNHDTIRASELKNDVANQFVSVVDDELDEEIDLVVDDFDDNAVKSEDIDDEIDDQWRIKKPFLTGQIMLTHPANDIAIPLSRQSEVEPNQG